jgi:hypothetical protein
VIVDHDHAAISDQGPEHGVAHISRVTENHARRGVRCNHGDLTYFKHIEERFIRDVGDVDHHAEAVQFAYNLAAERSQPVVGASIAGGVGPLGIQ